MNCYCIGRVHQNYENWLTSGDVIAIILDHFTRDSVYAIARICYANSVCPSVTRVLCVKTAKCIIEILSPSDRPIILVFRHQGSFPKSEGVTPNVGAKYKGGVAIFDQYAAISRKRVA